MNITEILDLIDSDVSARLTAPLIAEALAALPPEEIERARPAARLRGLARLPEEQRAKHQTMFVTDADGVHVDVTCPTDDEILMALEDPAADLELVAQRVCLRMHLAPIAEIEAIARAIATGPEPASTSLNRALAKAPWFVIAMARLASAIKRDKDRGAPEMAFMWRGRLMPDASRIAADAVVAVVRGDAEAYGQVGTLDEILPALQEGNGAHVFTSAADAPRAGSPLVWDITSCLRCVLRMEHSHDDPVGRFTEAFNKGDGLAALAAWQRMSHDVQDRFGAAFGGPRPDLDAIHAGLVAGTLDVDKAAKELSRWMAFAPVEEINAAIDALIDGIEDPHGDAATAAGRLQKELAMRPLFHFAMARIHRARKENKEHARIAARAKNDHVASILDRTLACAAGKPGPEPKEEARLASALAALDDETCALAMRMWLGEPPTEIEEIVSWEESWDDDNDRDAILVHMAIRPIDEARRIMAAIPGTVIPGLQGIALWRVVVERIRIAGSSKG